jgi:hypothetical protein
MSLQPSPVRSWGRRRNVTDHNQHSPGLFPKGDKHDLGFRRSNQPQMSCCTRGKDTHALSAPAQRTALEVLAGNGVDTRIQRDDGVTPTLDGKGKHLESVGVFPAKGGKWAWREATPRS